MVDPCLLAKKDLPFIDAYKLCLDVNIRKHASRDKDLIIGTLTHEVREKTNEAIEAAAKYPEVLFKYRAGKAHFVDN